MPSMWSHIGILGSPATQFPEGNAETQAVILFHTITTFEENGLFDG